VPPDAVPMTAARKKALGFGIGLNVFGAVVLLTVGTVKHVVLGDIFGVVEVLFALVALWTYRRTPVRPDPSPPDSE
jgi:hypothetical protein